jgi:predicted ferric reductase
VQVICLGFLLVLGPTLWFRRRYYEPIIIIHSLLSYVYVGFLWFHIPLKSQYNRITLITVSTILIFQKITQLFSTYFQNGTLFATNVTAIKRFDSIACVEVVTERPWAYRPGQYIHLRVPRIQKWFDLFFTQFQTHPYQVMWYKSHEEDGRHVVDKLHLLVQTRRGFSRWLNTRNRSRRIHVKNPDDDLELETYNTASRMSIPGSSGNLELTNYEDFPNVQIQGPYGNLDIDQYEKVVLLSNGIGIASHLAVAKYLIEAGKKTLTRRIDLFWYSQSLGKCRVLKFILPH